MLPADRRPGRNGRRQQPCAWIRRRRWGALTGISSGTTAGLGPSGFALAAAEALEPRDAAFRFGLQTDDQFVDPVAMRSRPPQVYVAAATFALPPLGTHAIGGRQERLLERLA